MALVSSAAASNPDVKGSSEKDDDRRWTVMVFMGADTIEGNEPLDEAAKDDLKEIAYVGGAKTLNIFVQIHRSTGPTRRIHFGFDGAQKTVAEETIPEARPENALINFISDSIERSNHRREDHSLLVLWGHAYDFAFARTRSRSGVIDAIDFVELSAMLQRLQDRLKEKYYLAYGDLSEARPTLDIVAFDACDVATVEMACQLQQFAKYLLGSEIGIPIPGWPYDRVLDRLSHQKGRLIAPPEFGSYAVRRYCESYPSSAPVSLTFLALAQANELRARAEILALTLAAAIGDFDERRRIAELFKQSQTAEGRPYVDVLDLCLNLVRHCGDPLVVEAARALGDVLISPRPPLVGKSATGKGRAIIADHGRNAGELARLNGISLYAPHVVGGTDADAVRGLYDQFVFARDTVWSQFVHTLAELS